MAKKLAFDRVLFTTVISLVAFGLTMVYSASAAIRESSPSPTSAPLAKQAVAALIGLVLMWVVMHFDYRELRSRVVVWTLVAGIAALLIAALWAPELNNSHRWLFIAGYSFQPSELAKLVLVVFLAHQLAKYEERNRPARQLVLASAVALALAVLVLAGRDLGTALMLGVITGLLMFLAGMPWLAMLGGSLTLLPAIAAAVVMVPYRRQRLLAFLDPTQDPQGAGYQALQSLTALGSGGLLGLGLGRSVQKLHYLPYPHSDFVFAIIGEELGLVGGLVVLGLFGIVLWRGFRAGLRAPDSFGKYLAWGLSGALSIQALVHMSVAAAILPATGITLPFISYGGSSLVVTLLTCALLLNVSQHG
jgi:cell division protein FtsW